VLSQLVSAQDDASKYDGALYNEADVQLYVLPDLMQRFDGQKINDSRSWKEQRRPEILQFFEQHIYGKIPAPPDPINKTFRVVAEDSFYFEGLCTRRDVRIKFSNGSGEVEMPLVLMIPNGGKGPYPAIYWFTLHDIWSRKFDPEGPQGYGKTRNQAPLKQLMLRGIALIALDAEALAMRGNDKREVLNSGIFELFFQPGQKNTLDDEWGLISVWAYAMTSGMDYIVTDRDIHPDQVAAMGSSIGGKTAIWAAAQDQRIGMVLSATSGHGGDALWKREFGETLDNMLTWLPRWLCRNASQFQNNIDAFPVDQHLLLACLAPRPLYVATAERDLWADPYGQWLGAYHAAPAYRLLNKEIAFRSETPPPLNTPIVKSHIGFHVRSGFHGLSLYDWERFMEFIEFHFMGIPIRSVHEIYFPKGELVDHYPNKLR
jgi:hypothetical protein